MGSVFDANVLRHDTEFPGDDRMLTHIAQRNIFPGLGADSTVRREPWAYWGYYVMDDARNAHGVRTDADAHAAVGYADYLARPLSWRFAEYCTTVTGARGEREES